MPGPHTALAVESLSFPFPLTGLADIGPLLRKARVRAGPRVLRDEGVLPSRVTFADSRTFQRRQGTASGTTRWPTDNPSE